VSVGLIGLGLVFVHLFRFSILCVFLIRLIFFSCIVCFCCVRFSFFSTMPRDWLGRTSPKWPILCPVGHKTLTHSINQAELVALMWCVLYALHFLSLFWHCYFCVRKNILPVKMQKLIMVNADNIGSNVGMICKLVKFKDGQFIESWQLVCVWGSELVAKCD